MKKKQNVWLTATLCLMLFSAFSLKSQNFHEERNGTVSIEAEHYAGFQGAWEEVEGRNAYTEQKQGFGASKITRVLGSEGLLVIADSPVMINWGRPGKNATSLACLETDTCLSVAFMYLKGDQIPGGKAAGIRMGIFSGRSKLNQHGWKILHDAFSKLLDDFHAPGKVLFVHGGDAPDGMDTSMVNKLSSWGLYIQALKDDQPVPANLDQFNMIYISESVSSTQVANRFKEVTIPVVVCEPYIFDDMGMVHSDPPWVPKPGQKGNAMLIRYGSWKDYLRYAIYFETPGRYHLQMLGQNDGSDNETEIHFALVGDGSEKAEVQSLVSLGQKPDWRKSDQTLDVQNEGWYMLYLYYGQDKEDGDALQYTSPYPSWRVDKLLLSLEETPVTGDGPDELLISSGNTPETSFEDESYFPELIWNVKDGFVSMEAEDIDHHIFWNLENKPSGYTGTGYLVWNGPPRERSIEGLGGNDDHLFVRQGPASEWLIIRVNIEDPGYYCVNARNIHLKEDGDNDAWVSMPSFRPDDPDGFDTMVRRMGDSHRDGEGFTWLDWGVRSFPLRKGVNHIYIGGRSQGFGIDRIAVYKQGDPEAENKALTSGLNPSVR